MGKFWAISLVMWASSVGLSKGFKVLDVDSAGVKVAQFGCNREPMTPQIDCHDYTGRVAIELDLRVLEAGYWKNNIHTEGLEAQVKTVGWHWEMGLHLTPKLDAFYEHHSRHVMEGAQPQYYDPNRDQAFKQKFPVEDSYGIRLHFYINPKPSSSVFGD
jgi:hypothetical protein